MADAPPRRRFLPEPIESSSKHHRRRLDHSPDNSRASSASTNTTADSLQSSLRTEVTQSSSPSTPPATDEMAPPATISTTTTLPTKPRRFLPQPIEETSRSSKSQKMTNGEQTSQESENGTVKKSEASISSPRRFAPEPFETSTSSTRRKFAPEPVETTARSSKDKPTEASEEKSNVSSKPKRRFAPEPVEKTTRSHKGNKDQDNASSDATPRRRFAPEPVEVSTRSSKEKKQDGDDESSQNKPRRKFLPQPVETSSHSSRKQPRSKDEDEEMHDEDDQITKIPSRNSSAGRRFTPELIETAKGSFKQGPRRSESQDSEASSRRSSTASESADEVPEIPDVTESRFSAAALAKRHPPERKHSYMTPDLPIIESDSGSDSSEAPSLTDSPSSVDTDSHQRRPVNKTNDSYADYVLSLASQTATEKELQEQAMAAYINERVHEPVAHFAIDEEEESGTIKVGRMETADGVNPRVFRRSSQADLDWEMSNMRKHHAKLEAMKKEFKADTAGYSRFSAAALASRHHIDNERKVKKAKENGDAELMKMRAAASPPMAGGDIVFPLSISPKMTRCDTDQVPRPRTDEDDNDAVNGASLQLWSSRSEAQPKSGGGLWMGMCQAPATPPQHADTPLRSGIQTPAPDRGMWGSHTPGRGAHTPGRGHETPGGRRGMRPLTGMNWLQLTPSHRPSHPDAFIDTVDKKLRLEKQIEEEFPDRVITQVYNYLSLGYPALAHAFDEELSKISRIPIEELRRDDELTDAKGYVGAPEGEGVDESEAAAKCKRWEALRLYVREWARQSPNFADAREKAALGGNSAAVANWGMAARKGSWGN